MAISNQTYLEFGDGDIGVASLFKDDTKLGLIALSSLLEPMNIGIDLTKLDKSDVEQILEKSEVFMLFKNVESVDVMIKALTNIKRSFEENND